MKWSPVRSATSRAQSVRLMPAPARSTYRTWQRRSRSWSSSMNHRNSGNCRRRWRKELRLDSKVLPRTRNLVVLATEHPQREQAVKSHPTQRPREPRVVGGKAALEARERVEHRVLVKVE